MSSLASTIVKMREVITADDVDHAVSAMVALLGKAVDRDWHVPAGDLTWSCWETVEHTADDLFAYAVQLGPKPPPLHGHVPFAWSRQREGGPANTIFGDPQAGNAGLIQVLEACGALPSSMVRTTSPDTRSHHIFGV